MMVRRVAPRVVKKGSVKSQKRSLKRRGKKYDKPTETRKSGMKPKYQARMKPKSVSIMFILLCYPCWTCHSTQPVICHSRYFVRR